VTNQATRILTLLSSSPHIDLDLELESHDFGGIAIDNFGVPLPDGTLNACRKADAVLLGESVGDGGDSGWRRLLRPRL
jgi:3-isopropylmalate dehydrogenase